eukprot:scaffold3402_cov169-Amphora_coffeaeformis.AAC.14
MANDSSGSPHASTIAGWADQSAGSSIEYRIMTEMRIVQHFELTVTYKRPYCRNPTAVPNIGRPLRRNHADYRQAQIFPTSS